MIAVYPGSFDPATNGHVDIIKRASKITDKLIVAILDNSSKNALFTVEERREQLVEITKDIKGVEVAVFNGLLVDFAKKVNAHIVIRGLRALTDFEYEFQMALTNRELASDVETLLIPTSTQYLYLSSSVIKEVAKFGGNYYGMVPEIVKIELTKKFSDNK